MMVSIYPYLNQLLHGARRAHRRSAATVIQRRALTVCYRRNVAFLRIGTVAGGVAGVLCTALATAALRGGHGTQCHCVAGRYWFGVGG
jgi:hypothetical protein